MGVSLFHGGTPKWLVYFMENPSRNGRWLGVPHFRKPPCQYLVGLDHFYFFPDVGNFIVPTDELICFRGVAKNHQPELVSFILSYENPPVTCGLSGMELLHKKLHVDMPWPVPEFILRFSRAVGCSLFMSNIQGGAPPVISWFIIPIIIDITPINPSYWTYKPT